MSEIQKKIDAAVGLLRHWCNEYDWSNRFLPGMEPDLTPQLCFSGGKDSVLTRWLCDRAKIKYNPVYSNTTIDPPPLIHFMRKYHADVVWNHPKENFFKLMVIKGFPIRQRRWCCAEYKESAPFDFLKIIGVRAAESYDRAKSWKPLTRWKNGSGEKFVLCPSLYFSDTEVWEIIKIEGLPYCELYDQGWERIGCIGCPMAKTRERKMHLQTFSGYDRLYRLAFSRLWYKRAGTISSKTGLEWFGSRKFTNSDDLFDWWVSGISSPDDLIKSGFELGDIEDNGCSDLFNFSDSCDLGMF